MHRKHQQQQRTAHKFQQPFQSRMVRNIKVTNSTTEILSLLEQVSKLSVDTATNNLSEIDTTAIIKSAAALLLNARMPRLSKSQQLMILMALFVVGTNALTILPEAFTCHDETISKEKEIARRNICGTPERIDTCRLERIEGNFEQSCKIVSSTNEFKPGYVASDIIYDSAQCDIKIDCVSEKGELQHYPFSLHSSDSEWRHNFSFTGTELLKSIERMSPQNRYRSSGEYIQQIMPKSEGNVCELANEEQHFKLKR